jgi:hypothetical protein
LCARGGGTRAARVPRVPENTARIKVDELHALLSTMTPIEQQPITARTFISDIEPEITRQLSPTPDAPVRFARSTPPPLPGGNAIEIRSRPARPITTTELATLPEPVAIRLQRRVLGLDARHVALVAAHLATAFFVGFLAIYFLA